jgi:hypothetical protein
LSFGTTTAVTPAAYAIEHEQQSILFRFFHQFVQFALGARRRRPVTRDGALVARPAGHAVKRLAWPRMRLHPEIARAVRQLLEPRIVTVGLDVQLQHVAGIVRQRGVDRVYPKQ